MKASLLSKRALAGVLGGAALVGVAVTGANAATSAASPAPSPVSHTQVVRAIAPAAVTPHAVGWSARVCFGGVQGFRQLQVNAPVGPGQAVAVSAAELNSTGDEFIGQAGITVMNVAVTNGLVTTEVDANWGSPLTVCLHYIA